MPPGCCGDISIFAELEDAISYSDPDEFKNAYFIQSNSPPLCLSRHKPWFFILKMPLMERILIG